MRKHLFALAGIFLLSACAAGPIADPNVPSPAPTPPAALTSAWNIACGVYSSSKASWDSAVALGLIQLDPGAVLWNGASEADLDTLCMGPPPTDVQSALAKVSGATAAMAIAVAKAHQGQAPLKVPAVKL